MGGGQERSGQRKRREKGEGRREPSLIGPGWQHMCTYIRLSRYRYGRWGSGWWPLGGIKCPARALGRGKKGTSNGERQRPSPFSLLAVARGSHRGRDSRARGFWALRAAGGGVEDVGGWGGITDDGRIIDTIRCRHLLTSSALGVMPLDKIRDGERSKKSRQWCRKVCLIFHVGGLDSIPLHRCRRCPSSTFRRRLYPSQELPDAELLLDITDAASQAAGPNLGGVPCSCSWRCTSPRQAMQAARGRRSPRWRSNRGDAGSWVAEDAGTPRE